MVSGARRRAVVAAGVLAVDARLGVDAPRPVFEGDLNASVLDLEPKGPRRFALRRLAGQTVVAVDPERVGLAEQHDTSVVAAHRGHRLGALLKTGMLQWLRDEQPQAREVDTWNAESNGFMIGVNQALGYRVMGRGLDFQKSL